MGMKEVGASYRQLYENNLKTLYRAVQKTPGTVSLRNVERKCRDRGTKKGILLESRRLPRMGCLRGFQMLSLTFYLLMYLQ